MANRTARQVLVVAAMIGVPSLAMGQEPSPAVRFVDPASMQVQRLTSAQLADLVAPIALYPDSLLSQVLVASTYPLDVVQAQQWLQRNGGLQGQALMDAARLQPWDASVQGLVAFPDALATLNEDVQWTTHLGNAFLAQEADVMAAVQDLRVRAQAAGRLSSSPQQTVSAVVEEGRTVIEIVPADPQVIYVPAYDPYYVWGAPAWVAYPPLSYGYGYGFGPGVNVGFWFGGWSWGWGWGWGPNWYGGSVYVNNAFFRHCGYNYGRHGAYHGGHGGGHGGHGGHGRDGAGGRETWKHDPGNRKGVPYTTGRGAGQDRAAARASRSSMTNAGNSRRSGSLSDSPSGDRAKAAGSRGAGRDEAWRTGSGTRASGPRGGGADRGWSSPGERSRSSRSLSQGRVPSLSPSVPSGRTSVPSLRKRVPSGQSSAVPPRASAPSPRGSVSTPRSSTPSSRGSVSTPRHSAPSSGYSVPRRSSSAAPQARGYQAAPRSSSSGSAGRSSSGGASQRSGGGGASRGTAGGRGSSGGSGGGGRRH
jgi:hypothetical protein